MRSTLTPRRAALQPSDDLTFKDSRWDRAGLAGSRAGDRASRGVGAAMARALPTAGQGRTAFAQRRRPRPGDGALGRGVRCQRARVRCSTRSSEVACRVRVARLRRRERGVGMYGHYLDLEPEHVEAMIDVNLKGTIYTAAATLPHLIAVGRQATSYRSHRWPACTRSRARRSTTRRSSGRSASRARSTTLREQRRPRDQRLPRRHRDRLRDGHRPRHGIDRGDDEPPRRSPTRSLYCVTRPRAGAC